MKRTFFPIVIIFSMLFCLNGCNDDSDLKYEDTGKGTFTIEQEQFDINHATYEFDAEDSTISMTIDNGLMMTYLEEDYVALKIICKGLEFPADTVEISTDGDYQFEWFQDKKIVAGTRGKLFVQKSGADSYRVRIFDAQIITWSFSYADCSLQYEGRIPVQE